MKLCTKCDQVYSDETLNFCLADGTPLVRSGDTSAETIVMSPAVATQPLQPVRQGVSPVFAYVAITLLALIAGGAIVAFLLFRSVPVDVSTQLTGQSTRPDTSPFQSQQPTPKPVSEVKTYADSPPPALTDEAVRNLLLVWEDAQNNRKFAAYQACYDPSFVGVKATKSGRSQTYSYASWMSDRRKMIANAVNLNVSHAQLQINVQGDTARVNFDQYYRSLKYSDWGPKEILVKMTPSGPKIVREELKASNPL